MMRIPIIAAILSLAFSPFQILHAQIPQAISYQGAIKGTQGTLPDGPYTMVFSIHDALEGGQALWGETQQVSIENEIFSVTLGSQNPLDLNGFAAAQFFLELQICPPTNPLSCTKEEIETLAPRQQLLSVPFAYQSEESQTASDCDTLDGYDQSAFVRRDLREVIDSDMIVDGDVTTADIGDNAITTEKIALSAITLGRLADNSVNSAKIADRTIQGGLTGDIALETISGANIKANAIQESHLQADAVSTEKLQYLSITTSKIAAGSITKEKAASDFFDGIDADLLDGIDSSAFVLNNEISSVDGTLLSVTNNFAGEISYGGWFTTYAGAGSALVGEAHGIYGDGVTGFAVGSGAGGRFESKLGPSIIAFGNVGIGILEPQEALDVDGSIAAHRIIGKATNPDHEGSRIEMFHDDEGIGRVQVTTQIDGYDEPGPLLIDASAVGINTGFVSAALHVGGDIAAERIRADNYGVNGTVERILVLGPADFSPRAEWHSKPANLETPYYIDGNTIGEIQTIENTGSTTDYKAWLMPKYALMAPVKLPDQAIITEIELSITTIEGEASVEFEGYDSSEAFTRHSYRIGYAQGTQETTPFQLDFTAGGTQAGLVTDSQNYAYAMVVDPLGDDTVVRVRGARIHYTIQSLLP